MLKTEQIYSAVEICTFRKVLQRTLACEARFEGLLDLLCGAPVMMSPGWNLRHVSHAASAPSFKSEWQRHHAFFIGRLVKNSTSVPRNLGSKTALYAAACTH